MNKNIVIIHYNTPYLTECLVRSINLFVKDAKIYIFDNSDASAFTSSFDNVTVFDNTKGQYIDFDKWLEKYPKKNLSPGRVNKWGSAKHCYSVEKCMEILKEPFVLLDSDVLLKKDISSFFNDKFIYTGEIFTQPHSTIKRVLPFLCYINTDMCIKHGVHYFDDNYMHGLVNTKKNGSADKYDTGAGFYINALKYEHRSIKCDDYIVHYGHGSWNKKGMKQKETQDEWTNFYKRLWTNEKNKYVVYTCITGNYDTLTDPDFISDNFDYVCFTDNDSLNSDIWQIRLLPEETNELSQVKKQRYVKINAHKLLEEYDLSIWVDGNVTLKGDLNKLLSKVITDDISVYVPEHPRRKCIYDEALAVISMKKDTSDIVNKQMDRYKKEGFPKKYGLLQSNILIRKHNNADCVKLMESWFNELKNNSHRDQLSFNYALWKNNDVNIKYLDRYIYKSEWFFWNGGHKKSKNFVRKSNNIVVHNEVKRKSVNQLKEDFKKLVEKHRKVKTCGVGLYGV